ncbi:MAG: polymer-forming cytoskeletal protein [Methylophilaceae bacterium]|nr:MAG: polymer-forming cytoskeletal protein [Methylophilaceae bacterium]
MENIKDSLLLGDGVNITGNISVQGVVHVHGNVNGEIIANEIYIGETGKVHGEIKVNIADIKGEVTNSIEVRDTLIVRSTGKISGTTSYQSLEIELGGIIDGNIVKSKAPLTPATHQLDNIEPVI